MSTINTQLPQLTKDFLEEVGKKYAANIRVVRKEDSWLMKSIGFCLKPFNPRFMSYITTVGTTIYMPDRLLSSGQELQCFNIIAHELQHIIDYKSNPARFVLGYLFPQCLSLLSIFALLGFLNPLMFFFLLFLVFLAPLPAPFRYQYELSGYRTSILLGRFFYHYSPEEMKQIYSWIVKEMTTGSYYFTWPFPSKVEQDLKDESSFAQPRFQEILQFLRLHNKIN
jgi:hypothetical protein